MKSKALVLAASLAAAAFVATAVAHTGGVAPCFLKLRIAGVTKGGQRHLNLVFTNADPSGTCKLSGWPSVELIGPVDPDNGAVYSLPRQSGHGTSVTLRPGQSAHAVLTWLPWESGNRKWTPGYVRVVVPTGAGASFPLALPWKYGAVLRQDSATHPGTYIGPVQAGS